MAKDDCYAAANNIQQALLPVDEALNKLLNRATPLDETETIPLLESNGRVLAQPIISSLQVPPADNSAMDGYAVRYQELAAESEKRLPISQRICAGEMGTELKPGTAARIFTGAPVPAGADAVIMQERCEQDGNYIRTEATPKLGENIRRAGEDINTGDTILKPGQLIRPQEMGLAASIGTQEVTVFRRMRVGVFFTGDELREPGTELAPGQIYNSNRYTLRGLLEKAGCEIIDLGIVEDNLDATRQALKKAAEQADLVMTSGGVSVGEEDHVRIALEQIGQLEMWRIKMKPGKPFTFGKIGNTPFIGLPGNPVSVFATFCIFARPYILRTQGYHHVRPQSFKVLADFDWGKKGPRVEYLRAQIHTNEKGENHASLYPHQGSGVLTSASWAHGLVVISADSTVQTGDLVEYLSFQELS